MMKYKNDIAKKIASLIKNLQNIPVIYWQRDIKVMPILNIFS